MKIQIKGRQTKAKLEVNGEYDTESKKLTIFKGSQVCLKNNESFNKRSKSAKLRKQLCDDKTIDGKVFAKDFTFENPSSASDVIYLTSTDGYLYFSEKSSGMKLADFLAANAPKFTWVQFYEEFANILLEYKNKRAVLCDKIRKVKKLVGDDIKLEIRKSKAADDGDLEDVDPFSVFSPFNDQKTVEKRLKVAEAYKQVFNITTPAPKDFEGVPHLARIFMFGHWPDDQKAKEIDEIGPLWNIFESGIKFADGKGSKEDFITKFDQAIKIYQAGMKLCMGLYWARPRFYVSLDSPMQSWLIKNGYLKKANKINGNDYLDLLEKFKAKEKKNIYEVSLDAVSSKSTKEKTKKNSEDKTQDKTVNTIEVQENSFEDEFLEKVYVSRQDYDQLKYLLEKKKNIILCGPPGVGKTYAAKRLAETIIQKRSEDQILEVQFHQSYGYEEFVLGFKPTATGHFVLQKGPFLEFCLKAKEDPENKYFLIIDEINRGNVSKIFGELLVLIEEDKRLGGSDEKSIRLLYKSEEESEIYERFSVPNNLYIIGMMNKADRNLTTIDYALRRRFAFFNMAPAFDNENFIKNEITAVDPASESNLKAVIEKVKELNEVIANDNALGEDGKDFEIGHSYFCLSKYAKNGPLDKEKINKILESVIKYEIIPLLKEYWFDNDNLKNWDSYDKWLQK